MKNLSYLTFTTFIYSLAVGLIGIGIPQLALNYGLTSADIGKLGAAMPLGYGIACIAFGQLFRGLSGKHVIIVGVVISTLSVFVMTALTTIWPLFIANFIYGAAQGAVWPFVSAWMLDFQSATISRTRVLRFYNIGWTSGCALGMYLAGELCDHKLVLLCVFLSAALNGFCIVGALLATAPHSHQASSGGTAPTPAHAADRIGFAIFVAAALANVGALASRAMVTYNYPELNRALHFDAQRMGLIGAAALGGQTVAFAVGHVYERYLGRRRVYTFLSAVLIASSLSFAFSQYLPFAAVFIASASMGVVLAMSFQSGLLAATEYFSSPRIGTTVHEGLVGFAQALTWLAGLTAQNAKSTGVEPLTALRLPFLLLPGMLGVFLLIQLYAISSTTSRRILLPSLGSHERQAAPALASALNAK